jgi:tripartite ATP-independent transporter DctM subunit
VLLLAFTFILLLLLRVPVSFTLLMSSLVYIFANDIPLRVVTQRLMAGPDSFPLMAVPFFMLAGSIMNTGGITSRIFNFADKMVGHYTGGLGHANILASIIFSGMSGTAIADVGGLGAIELKAMRDAGYPEDFSLAVTAGSSAIGPIIPPSVPAVVFGAIGGVSIGRLFIGGIVPGLLMGLVMSILVYFQSKKAGYPKREKASVRERLVALKEAFLSLLTPVIILGGIMGGIFTPTEAAIIATLYSLILALYYKEFTIRDIPKIALDTIGTMVSVLFIVAAASLFGWVLAVSQLPQAVTSIFVSYFSSKYAVLLAIVLILFFVGTFMETIAAITILTPILMPVANHFGIDPVHFGLLLILNLMIGLMTPPVGMVLYVLSSVSGVPFERIAKSCIPYVVLLTITLLIFLFVPQIVLFLPNLLFD